MSLFTAVLVTPAASITANTEPELQSVTCDLLTSNVEQWQRRKMENKD